MREELEHDKIYLVVDAGAKTVCTDIDDVVDLFRESENNGPKNTRWEQISVDKTENGNIVACFSDITCWQGEKSHHDYRQYSSIEALAESLDATQSLDREILDQIDMLDTVSEEI